MAVMRPIGWSASAGRYIASAHQLVPTSPTRTVPCWLIASVWQGSGAPPKTRRASVCRGAETPVVEVDERLADLCIGVHHERAVASDRFADGFAGQDDDLRLRADAGD